MLYMYSLQGPWKTTCLSFSLQTSQVYLCLDVINPPSIYTLIKFTYRAAPPVWFLTKEKEEAETEKMALKKTNANEKTRGKQWKVMRRNIKRDTAHSKKKKKVGGYWEGELPVAIATAGTLVQSPRQCLVARERFGRRGKGAQQAAALPPTHPTNSPRSGMDDRDYSYACLPQASPSRRIFHTLLVTPCLLSLSVCVSFYFWLWCVGAS